MQKSITMERLPEKHTDRILRERKVVPIDGNAKEPEKKSLSLPVIQPCYKTGMGEYKHPHSIKIHLNGGATTKSMDYIHLRDKHYDKDAGIILFYTNATITIYGEHLDRLYELLDHRKIASISVYENHSLQGNPMSNQDDEIAMVTQIDVKYKEKGIEQEIEQMRQNAFKKKSNSSHSR